MARLAAAGILAAGAAHAGRPLTVDDADPADAGHFELEAGAAYEDTPDCTHWDFPFGLAWGAGRRVELSLGFGGQLEERVETIQDTGARNSDHASGMGDLAVAAKWQAIPHCPLGARHALAAAVKFPTADEDDGLGSGETDYDLTWIMSAACGADLGLHLNAGYSWLGSPEGENLQDVVHAGLAVDYQLAEDWQWVGEAFAERETTGGADTIAQFNIGLRWNAADNVTFDMAAGSKLTREAPDFTATIGLTWAFAPAESTLN